MIKIVRVFVFDGDGGNPCPVACDASGMSVGEMQSLAQQHGHECGFVLPPPSPEFDYTFRFWVPNHEMDMCGHATIGALWLLASKERIHAEQVRISTRSGQVTGFVSTSDGSETPSIEITQPAGRVRDLDRDAEERVLAVLRLDRTALLDLPIQNAITSRTKTLIPVKTLQLLHSLQPDYGAIEDLCTIIGSTGLYPYVQNDDEPRLFEARQFPKSSGYPEDAATGIAASALSFGLLSNDLVDPSSEPIRIMQGRAMGALSQINVRLGFAGERAIGCLVGGAVSAA